MRLLIGADIVPTESNLSFFQEGKIEKIIDDKILSVLSGADIRIFNLEVPLTDEETPIKKCGPALRAPVSTVQGIKKLNPTLLTLANNHITDQDVQGMESTIRVLRKQGINFFGVGENLEQAAKPYLFEQNGKKVGIYACAEHEFSIAEENKPGANPFDALESLDHIRNLRKECDYVIVLYHGGREHYRYPSPYLQKVCRKICDCGADLVVCQHSHCIGCEEKHGDATIVYGQGNFLFDVSEIECWQTGLLISFDTEKKQDIEYIPICKNGNGVRLASETERKEIIKQFQKRSEEILIPGFIKKNYQELANTLWNQYIGAIYGTSLLFRIFNKLSGYKLKQKISRKSLLFLKNSVRCEAHRELLENINNK